MTLDSRDISIISQVSAKIAADLTAAAADTPIDSLVADWKSAFPQVRDALVEEIAFKIAEGAFPGSTPVQVPADAPWAQQTSTAPAPAPVVPQSQPAAIPGVTDGDPAVAALWQELAADPSQWYDNRVGKTNPKSPDFRHKTQGAKNTGNKSLWIIGQKNPSWVPQLVATLRF